MVTRRVTRPIKRQWLEDFAAEQHRTPKGPSIGSADLSELSALSSRRATVFFLRQENPQTCMV